MKIFISHIQYSINSKQIIKNCSLHLEQGESLALIGLSGCGKTTLLRLIAGLETPQKGEIQSKGSIAYMPQKELLLPWLTVKKNILLPLTLQKKELTISLKKILEFVELKGCENAYPAQLSGGMKQRVAFARTIAQEANWLLLDEPFNAVDLLVKERLYIRLKKVCREKKQGLIFVSHDFRDALALADKVCVMQEGQLSAPIPICDHKRSNPHYIEEVYAKIRAYLECSQKVLNIPDHIR